jgi:tRNA uridine 5-carboxymethylaminomethyl modification enzyme
MRWAAFNRKRDAVALELERLKSTWVNPRILATEEAARVLGRGIEREYTLTDLLRRPGVSYRELVSLRGADGQAFGTPVSADPVVAEQVEITVKYAGYIARQGEEVARHESHESTRIPTAMDYDQVRGLSIEVRQKLKSQRPETVGQAARISGVTPAAVSLLLVHLKRLAKSGGASQLAA